ncbi:MAG: hypothetical protein ABI364_01840, partial [Caldimonas sp.]
MAHAPGALSTPAGALPASAAIRPAERAGGAAPPDAFLLLRDQVRGTFSFNSTSLAGHAIGATIVELLFADVAPRGLRLTWGITFAVVWLV